MAPSSSSSSSTSLLEWFQDSTIPPSVLLLDGGVSTYLEHVLRAKNRVFSHRALWSSSLLLDGEREIIQNAHQAFVHAGADICSTVTFQCHYTICTGSDETIGISKDQMTKMLRDGVQWCKSAVSTSSSSCYYVAASSGCYGASLANGSEYTGDYGNDKNAHDLLSRLIDFHQRKFQVLMDESPDAVAIETIPNLLECRAVMTMLQRITTAQQQQQQQQQQDCNPHPVAVWISLACQDGNLLNDGSKFEDALDVIQEMDPNAHYGVGINCCDSLYVPSLLTRLVRHMTKHAYRRVIVIYPNSGEQWDAQQSTWKEGTGCTCEEEFANRIVEAIRLVRSEWNKLGNDKHSAPKMIVGGCCRTSPTTIGHIRKQLDTLQLTKLQ